MQKITVKTCLTMFENSLHAEGKKKSRDGIKNIRLNLAARESTLLTVIFC